MHDELTFEQFPSTHFADKYYTCTTGIVSHPVGIVSHPLPLEESFWWKPHKQISFMVMMVKLFIFPLLLLAKPCVTFMSCLLAHASLPVCLVSMQTDKIKGPVSLFFLFFFSFFFPVGNFKIQKLYILEVAVLVH